jgi:hypothetical protein
MLQMLNCILGWLDESLFISRLISTAFLFSSWSFIWEHNWVARSLNNTNPYPINTSIHSLCILLTSRSQYSSLTNSMPRKLCWRGRECDHELGAVSTQLLAAQCRLSSMEPSEQWPHVNILLEQAMRLKLKLTSLNYSPPSIWSMCVIPRGGGIACCRGNPTIPL